MPDFELKFTNLEEVLATVDPKILEGPLRNFFQKAVQILERRTKKMTPVVTGRLRASIHSKLDARPIPLFGGIETNVIYAPPVEARRHMFQLGIEWSKRQIENLLYEAEKTISDRWNQ
ncbi:MAG: hypothetical protein Q8O55_11430 [Dehalococcoidales bacterium]|nr:hypothetical protein [Dehalococcoidales bacterium]